MTNKDILLKITDKLDQNQLSAVMAPQGASLVVAGAGTGKTTTLTARIAMLISRGMPASSIMAVTFTNKAAIELRERVEKHVGVAAVGLRIGTFHSLSARILRKYAELVNLSNSNFTIADEEDARHLMSKAVQIQGAYGVFSPCSELTPQELKQAKKEWDAGLKSFVDQALRKVSMWKGWGLTDNEATDPNRPEKSLDEERFATAYGSYQHELESRNLVDFGDLILKVVRVLQADKLILERESASVRHMLVDEAQDANSIQVEWVKLLTSYHGGLTAVGDDDQNIYGFQGGYTGAMEDMVGHVATRYVLNENRRCTKEILEPANIMVDYNRRKQPKLLNSFRSGSPVRSTGHMSEVGEATWIAARISELIEGGTRPENIAVLFRSAYVIQPYEEAILKKGIPSIVTSGSSLLVREEVKDLLSIVKLATNPFDDLSFIRLASRPQKGLGTAAIGAIVALSSSRMISFHEACLLASSNIQGIGFNKNARDGAALLGNSLAILAEQGEWCHPTHDIMTTGLEKTGYQTWLAKQEGGETRLANIEAILRLAEMHEDPIEFLQTIALLSDSDISTKELKGKVRLSTIHSVKGLEFDHVFCPAFDYGVMPNLRAVDAGSRGKPDDKWNGPDGGGLEEERRLAHVAFTRARHGLDVSFAWSRGKYNKSKAGGPSSFMEEAEFKWNEIGVDSSGAIASKKPKARAGRVGFRR